MKAFILAFAFLLTSANTFSQLTVNITTSEPLCYGQSNGSIYLNVTGGTSPYTFTVEDTAGTQLNNNNSNAAELIPVGWYYYWVVDDVGNTVYDSVYLDGPDSVWVEYVSSVIPTCGNQSDGEITLVTVNGTQGPWTAIWQPSGQTGVTATGLSSGWHNVTIVDSVGCIGAKDVYLSNSNEVIINYIASNPSYCRGNGIYPGSGTVSGTGMGGTGTLTYQWQGPQGQSSNTNTWGNRIPGWYYLTVTDNVGCSALDSVYVDSLNPEAVFSVDPLWGIDPLDVNIHDSSSNRVTNSWSFYSPSDSTSMSYIIGYDSLQPMFSQQLQGVGQHWVCLVVANDYECYDTTCIDIQVGTAGIDHHEGEDFIVYPNPTQGWVTISVAPSEIREVKLYDVYGRLIFIENKQSFDVSSLSEGKYFLQVVSTKGTYYKTIIKE